MSYQVFWIIDNHIFYNRYQGDIVLNDIRGASIEIANLLDEANAVAPNNQITGIIDMREAGFASLLRSALSVVVGQITAVIDPRIWLAKPGFVVLITDSAHARTAVSLVVKLSNQPLTSVGSLDEALGVMSSMYPELQASIKSYLEKHMPADSRQP